jgi:hypothetical protein
MKSVQPFGLSITLVFVFAISTVFAAHDEEKADDRGQRRMRRLILSLKNGLKNL